MLWKLVWGVPCESVKWYFQKSYFYNFIIIVFQHKGLELVKGSESTLFWRQRLHQLLSIYSVQPTHFFHQEYLSKYEKSQGCPHICCLCIDNVTWTRKGRHSSWYYLLLSLPAQNELCKITQQASVSLCSKSLLMKPELVSVILQPHATFVHLIHPQWSFL